MKDYAIPLRNTKFRKKLIREVADDEEDLIWFEYLSNKELLEMKQDKENRFLLDDPLADLWENKEDDVWDEAYPK